MCSPRIYYWSSDYGKHFIKVWIMFNTKSLEVVLFGGKTHSYMTHFLPSLFSYSFLQFGVQTYSSHFDEWCKAVPLLHISHRTWGEGNQPRAQTPLCWGTAPKVCSPTSDVIVVVVFFSQTGCDATCCPKWLPGRLGQAVRQQISTHYTANSSVGAMLYSGSICIQ